MDQPDRFLEISNPVLYACAAIGVSLAAVTLGYLYTRQQRTDVDGHVNKSKTRESEQTDAKPISQLKSAKNVTNTSNEDSVVTSGAWPTEDKPEILPMPENIPENLKKILDMGFPGCPVFRRMGKLKEEAVNSEKQPAPEKQDRPIEDKPEVLPMPENIPEEIKKVLDMGFPGCPVFQRMSKPVGGEGNSPDKGREPSTIGPVYAGQTVEGAAGQADGATAAAGDDSPIVLPIPPDMPEDLKKVLELGIPGAKFERIGDATEEYAALTLDEKSMIYAQALRDSLGSEALGDLASLAEVLKSSGVMEAMGSSSNCPRGTHCGHHCTCLFKVSHKEDATEDSDEAEDEPPQIMPIPEDAPENIKRILEMGFPGCPMFRRAPVKSGDKNLGSTMSKMPGPSIVKNPKAEPSKNLKKKEGEGDAAKQPKAERDPVEYCSHLQSEVKRTKQKVAIDKIEEKMSEEQKEEERKIQSEQLAAIFSMMQSQQDKFGVDSMDEIRSQMKLYM